MRPALQCLAFYRPQRSCGQGNVFTGVCLSTGGEGVCLSACWDAICPRDQADPPRSGRPPPQIRQTPPLGPGRHPPRTRQTPPWDLADTPPGPGRHPRDQADTPPGPGRPPPGSRLQHTVYERQVHILLECILVCCFVPNFARIMVHHYESILGEISFVITTDYKRDNFCAILTTDK